MKYPQLFIPTVTREKKTLIVLQCNKNLSNINLRTWEENMQWEIECSNSKLSTLWMWATAMNWTQKTLNLVIYGTEGSVHRSSPI